MSHKNNRRNFLKTAASCALAASLPGRSMASSTQPNILFITADDLGWRELGSYGNPDVRTPNIDRLAGRGVRFTNAFVTAPSCSASRASMITGQAPHSVNVLGLTHRHPQYQMPTSHPTMARSLKNAGYVTGIHGKWHVAAYKPPELYGYQARMSLMKISDSAKARWFITALRDRPFYLELNFTQPHRTEDGSFKMHPDFPVDPDKISIPEYWQIPDWPEIREDVAKYYSQIAFMDHMIGEVLDHLHILGLADKTLVVLVSDNGAPYPGVKTTCYDRGIGAPLIFSWPGTLPKGEVRDELVSTIDIMPTCLDAAGVPVPEPAQGKSLMPLLGGERGEIHDEIFAEVTYHIIHTPMRAIRNRQFKLIENYSDDPTGLDQNECFEWARRVAQLPGQRCCAPRPPEELFDISADPRETANLADDHDYAGVKAELHHRLIDWRRRTNDPFELGM